MQIHSSARLGHCVSGGTHLLVGSEWHYREWHIQSDTNLFLSPPVRQYIFIESGGDLSRDNLVSMKNLNGFCGDSGVKFNLFLIYYSRYEKEKNWMSDGQKLVLSLHTLPPKAHWAYIIEIEQDENGNLKPTYRKPLGRLPVTLKTTFPSIPCLCDLWLHFTVIEN